VAKDKNDTADSHAANSATWSSGYAVGTQEFAGHAAMRIDKMMEGDLTLRDQEILYELRKQLAGEVQRRYPNFDLDAEAKRHR
jgi:hypothetical protein